MSRYPMHAEQLSGRCRSPSRPVTNPYLEAGKVGAIIGLCGAGATNLRRLQAQRIDTTEAVVASVRTAAATGLATATTAFVASRFSGGLTSLAVTVATGTLAMYLIGTERLPTPETQFTGDVR